MRAAQRLPAPRFTRIMQALFAAPALAAIGAAVALGSHVFLFAAVACGFAAIVALLEVAGAGVRVDVTPDAIVIRRSFRTCTVRLDGTETLLRLGELSTAGEGGGGEMQGLAFVSASGSRLALLSGYSAEIADGLATWLTATLELRPPTDHDILAALTSVYAPSRLEWRQSPKPPLEF